MNQQELRKELELLQAKLDKLNQKAESADAQEAPPTPAGEEGDAGEIHNGEHSVFAHIKQAVESESLIPDDVKQQLETLIHQIDDEVRELPPMACLTIFTAGLLLGRYMR